MRIRSSLLATVIFGGSFLALPSAAGAAAPEPDSAASFAVADSGWADNLPAYGLSGEGKSLVSFRPGSPDKAKNRGTITGLSDDTSLVGIDYRVQNGKLYGVGNLGGIYTLSGRDATKVGQLSIALAGTNFGVDFNPAANALRVISDQGQNLRQPFAATGDAPNGATVLDGALNYVPAAAAGISGAAYTNNDLSTDTATSLYDLDTLLDQIAIQAPANAGSLSATGKLGLDAGSDAGFDIYSLLENGRTVDNVAFATLSVGGTSQLYAINPITGGSKLNGAFSTAVTDIAIRVQPATPVADFSDVGPDYPFYEEISWAVENGITTGNSNGTFAPGAPISREAAAAMIFRFANPGATKPVCTEKPFPDVPIDSVFCGEIAFLKAAGISTGYDDGKFYRAHTIKRDAIAAYLYRLGNPGATAPTCTVDAFPDVTTAHPFCGEITWMVQNNLTTGYSDGNFKPAKEVARDATVTFLFRLSAIV